jgi:hypothetical protein
MISPRERDAYLVRVGLRRRTTDESGRLGELGRLPTRRGRYASSTDGLQRAVGGYDERG